MNVSFTDQQLLSMVAEGDEHAFKEIYSRYWTGLYDTAFKRLKNSKQSQDIVQDVFIGLWERREDLQIRDLAAYLHTAVRYRVYNFVSRDLASEAFFEPFEAVVAYSAGADEMLIEKEIFQLATAYIATLPKKRKQIFTLYTEENLSTTEIARRLNISRKTVQNQLGTAISGLKANLLPVLLLLYYLSIFH